MLLSNMASGLISMEFDLHGPNMCIVNRLRDIKQRDRESWRIIKFGDADIFLPAAQRRVSLKMVSRIFCHEG